MPFVGPTDRSMRSPFGASVAETDASFGLPPNACFDSDSKKSHSAEAPSHSWNAENASSRLKTEQHDIGSHTDGESRILARTQTRRGRTPPRRITDS